MSRSSRCHPARRALHGEPRSRSIWSATRAFLPLANAATRPSPRRLELLRVQRYISSRTRRFARWRQSDFMTPDLRPDEDDVVIREKRGNPSSRYVLGTPSAPDQFAVRTRDAAVSQALSFARQQGVRAWFANADHEFALLGTFRKDPKERVKSSQVRSSAST
jgi:hypothetical protein